MRRTLIGDIGGTNSRLAVTGPSGPQDMRTYENVSTDGLETAIAQYLETSGERPTTAVLAVAGPIAGRRARLTNRDWVIDLDRIEQRFGLSDGVLLNDFEALAWALPVFGPDDVRALGPDLTPGSGPMVALGPGTGMGVSGLVPTRDGFVAVATEAGHMSFGPAMPDEWPVFQRLALSMGSVSAEMVLSGPGLERLHAARLPDAPHTSAPAITDAAHAGDADAKDTIAMFVRLLGRFAGDVALAFKATGGVFVAGGVAQKLASLIDAAAFRTAFETHPPFRDLLAAIPTRLVISAEPGLLGCAAYATERDRRLPAAN